MRSIVPRRVTWVTRSLASRLLRRPNGFAFDLRWNYAGGVDLDYPVCAHTVLVDMRERL
jgi:hypothetical protein